MALLDQLYGAFGNPLEADRRRMYNQQTGALSSDINRASQAAQQQAMGAATSAGAGGNPYLSQRVGAQAAGDAAAQVQAAGVSQQRQLSAQQQAQELQARQQQGQWAQQAFGGLLNAGGQVLGMAIPAFGALRGAAQGTGIAGSLGQSGGVGSLLGSALGAQQPQPFTPQADPSGMTRPLGGAYTPPPTPGGTLAASTGGLMAPAPAGAETWEQRMRRLQLGGFGGGMY